jgi:hypothetical protein
MQNQSRNLVIVALVAALVAVMCWKQSQGQGEAAKPAKPAVVKWEYQVEHVYAVSQRKTTRDELNLLGNDGWEVCAAFAPGQIVNGSGTSDGRVILKRLKAEK